MATYTVAELQDYTSVAAVDNWSDDKILLYQSMAESILDGLNMNTTMSGYSTAYNSAVVLVFDWLAENPAGLRSSRKGKVNKAFEIDNLPGTVQRLLKKFIEGSQGTLTGVQMQRRDIGLR